MTTLIAADIAGPLPLSNVIPFPRVAAQNLSADQVLRRARLRALAAGATHADLPEIEAYCERLIVAGYLADKVIDSAGECARSIAAMVAG
jgi:hypothetical protein